KELRIGAHRDAPAKGTGDASTPIGRELATGNWTAMFWGRGTLLNLSGITPVATELPAQASAAIHAVALFNELGLGLQVDAAGVGMRGIVRTTWANPSPIWTKAIAIAGSDIVSGKALATAKSLAAVDPSSPFAQDFAAGQGGLMVPAAAIG